MNPQIFKAYDIRGKYPDEINKVIVFRIVDSLIKAKNPKKIVVGHDVRISSPKLYQAVNEALKNFDIKIISAGLITTPMLYFLVNHHKADLGVVVTASHNPKEYNGLKIVGKNAVPISPVVELRHLFFKNKNQ
ncbi:hypothetical protein HZB05_00645 [Candidatus Wolfebacteria bacterium]|nr:hypothetical protein [Candidatus Wolfebacteria bacterium]